MNTKKENITSECTLTNVHIYEMRNEQFLLRLKHNKISEKHGASHVVSVAAELLA